MKRAIKWVCIGLAGLVVLLVVAVALLFLLVDPNDYKQDIAKAVHDQTGRTLTFEGDLDLSVFPWLGISLPGMTLSNAQGFGDTPFARMKGAKVGVKLLPLVTGKGLEMEKVALAGLALNLEKNAEGVSNWEDLAPPAKGPDSGKDKAPAPAVPDASDQPPATKESLPEFYVKGVEITDCSISYKDLKAGQDLAVTNASFVTGTLELGKPFDADIGFSYDSNEPDVHARVSISGTINLDVEKETYSISKASIEAKAEGKALPGEKIAATLTSDLVLNTKAGTLDVSSLILKTLGITVTGAAGARHLNATPVFSGNIHIADFSPKNLIAELGMDPIATQDPGVLGKASGKISFEGGANAFHLSKMDLALDDTAISGKGFVKDFSSPQLGFIVKVDAINVDRYLPPKKEGAREEKAPTPGAEKSGHIKGEPIEIPADDLKKLNLEGSASIGSLQAAGLKMKEVEARVLCKNGLLKLERAGLKMYGGAMEASSALDVGKATPAFTASARGTDLDFGPMLGDLTGDVLLTGKGKFNAGLSAAGKDTHAMVRSLGGNVSFNLADGSVKGVNLGKIIRDAAAVIRGTSSGGDQGADTDFVGLSAMVNIVKGVAYNDDLKMLSPLLRVTGKGQADLDKETVNYTVMASVERALADEAGIRDLADVTVPITFTGTFAKVDYKLNTKVLAAELVKKKGGDLIKGVLDKSGVDTKKLGVDPGKLIKGFFK